MKIILKEYKTLWKTTIIKKPGILYSGLFEIIVTFTIMCVVTFNKSLVIHDLKINQLLFQVPIAFLGMSLLLFTMDIMMYSSFRKNELIIFSKIHEKRFHYFLIAKFLFYFTICLVQWFLLIILLLSVQKINNYFLIIWYLVPVIFIPFVFVGINALVIKLNLLKKTKLVSFIIAVLLIQGATSLFIYYPNLFLKNESASEVLNYFAPFFYIIYLQAHILSTIDFYAFIPLIYYSLLSIAFIIWLITENKKKGNIKWHIEL